MYMSTKDLTVRMKFLNYSFTKLHLIIKCNYFAITAFVCVLKCLKSFFHELHVLYGDLKDYPRMIKVSILDIAVISIFSQI